MSSRHIQIFFYEQLHLLLMLLLLILMISEHFQLMVQVYFLLKAIQFSVMVVEFYLITLLIVLFYGIEFLIILYQLMNYLQKLCETSNLVYQLITIYEENNFYHYDHQQYFANFSKLLYYRFVIPDFNLLSCKQNDLTFKVL